MQLIWDINKFRCHVNQVELAIAPAKFPPFTVGAIIEEQDTALILDESDEIRDPGNKPLWFYANKLDQQSLLDPGQVITRDTQPLRLQAIIHDLESEPICNELWIFQAIQQAFEIAENRQISALLCPLLGCKFGKIAPRQFFSLLLEIVNRQRPAPVERLWISVPEENCETVFNILSELITDSPQS